jgi:hypothetical protein
MNRNGAIFGLLILALAAWTGCSSQPAAEESKKADIPLEKIEGKIQVLQEPGSATESALNAGGSSVYLWVADRRYRLFLRTPADVVHGDEYVAEGIYAQKAIDEMGDPDQGKNGYPLLTSCQHVVRMAWKGMSFDDVDNNAEALRTRVKRYPARPVFLVTRIWAATAAEKSAAAAAKKDAPADDKKVPEVTVAAEKQRALLVEGSQVLPAPLWQPQGGTVQCKVLIGPDGKIADLETGSQLCESVLWSQFRYKPPVQAGHPVKVETDVEMRFDPRK